MTNRRKNGIEEADGHEVVLTKSQSSVTIKRDSKGTLGYEVKAYADTVEDAVNEAAKAVRMLEKAEAIGAFDVKSPNGPVLSGLKKATPEGKPEVDNPCDFEEGAQ